MSHLTTINDLNVTQNGFRLSVEELREMVDYVAAGGSFSLSVLSQHNPNRRPTLIAITEFEDGTRYIRDGFHRAFAICVGRGKGNPVLFSEEYVIEHMTYQQFFEINIQAGYFTPFDPRTEVRRYDFGEFRSKVFKIIEDGQDPTDFIWKNRSLFMEPRLPNHSIQFFSEQLMEMLAESCAA